MDVSGIAATSISMHTAQVSQQADISVMKKAMQQQENDGAALIQSLQTASPASNHALDILA